MFLKSKENYKKAASIYHLDQSPVPPKNFLAQILRISTRSIDRSSRSEVFCKKRIFKSFVKFTRKHLCQKKRDLWRRCFPVNLAKFLKHCFWRTLPVVPFVLNYSSKVENTKSAYLPEHLYMAATVHKIK